MKYIVTINDKNYEVEVEKGEARVVKTSEAASIPAIPIPAAAAPAAPSAAPAPVAAAAPVATVAGEKIAAPMPGTILHIKKNAGEAVKKGEPVMILEAMKMENEIIAPRDGVIAQIVAAKGASVNTGDVLAVLQ
jgi:biotin carboxyl carrier protein